MTRILIVEDEVIIALDAQNTLSEAGYDVTNAASVTQAIQALTNGGVDAAVLDACLRGETAEPVAEALQDRGIPYVVVSGYSDCQRIGMLAHVPFLEKPYDPAKLVATIRSMVHAA